MTTPHHPTLVMQRPGAAGEPSGASHPDPKEPGCAPTLTYRTGRPATASPHPSTRPAAAADRIAAALGGQVS
jgi:hypothetical protein